MRYLEADARHQDPSLVYLPARAASIAMALSSIASFVAVVFLTRLTVEAPLETGHIVVVGFTAAAFLVFVCTGLVIAYARFLPPATTRIWGLVHFVVPYLALLWAVCFALSGAVLGEVLLPLMSCTRPYPTLCLTWLRHRALQTVAVASIALAASLALCILVSLDLHSTHPEASVVILRYELAEQRARQAQARGVRAMQAALEAPLLGDESDGVDEGPSGYPPSWAKGRRATVRAYAARARLPVDDPEAAWPAFVAAQPSSGPRTVRQTLVPPPSKTSDALGLPAMFSPGKRYRARSRSRERHGEDAHARAGEQRHERRHHGRSRVRSRADDEGHDSDKSATTGESTGGLDDESTASSTQGHVRGPHRQRRAESRHLGSRRPEDAEHGETGAGDVVESEDAGTPSDESDRGTVTSGSSSDGDAQREHHSGSGHRHKAHESDQEETGATTSSADDDPRNGQSRGGHRKSASQHRNKADGDADGGSDDPATTQSSLHKSRHHGRHESSAHHHGHDGRRDQHKPHRSKRRNSHSHHEHPKRKHHRHRSSSETDEEAEERRRRHKREKKRRQAKLDADANTGNVVTTRMEAASGGGTDAA